MLHHHTTICLTGKYRKYHLWKIKKEFFSIVPLFCHVTSTIINVGLYLREFVIKHWSPDSGVSLAVLGLHQNLVISLESHNNRMANCNNPWPMEGKCTGMYNNHLWWYNAAGYQQRYCNQYWWYLFRWLSITETDDWESETHWSAFTGLSRKSKLHKIIAIKCISLKKLHTLLCFRCFSL